MGNMNLTFKRLWVFAIAVCCLSASLPAKVERTTVYIFGFSASFTDSVAYITDVQRLDSAYVETKGDFLVDRVVYSDQLQTYLEVVKGMQNSTCAVFFAMKKNKLQGEYDKIMKQYAADGNVVLKTLEPGAFNFQSPVYETPPAMMDEEALPERPEPNSMEPGREPPQRPDR